MPAGGSPRNPFIPTSDQPWLSAGSILDGAAEYSFTANTTGAPRTAHLTVLGVPVTITQAGAVGPVRATAAGSPDKLRLQALRGVRARPGSPPAG